MNRYELHDQATILAEDESRYALARRVLKLEEKCAALAARAQKRNRPGERPAAPTHDKRPSPKAGKAGFQKGKKHHQGPLAMTE